MHALVFNKTKIRLVSLFLCFSLCISMTLGMVVQEPAHAELVLTATTAMVAAAVFMITAMGITFVTTGDAQRAATAFVNSSQEVHDLFRDFVDNIHSGGSSNGGNGDGSNKIKLNAACNAALVTLFSKAKEFFHIGSVSKGTVFVPSDTFHKMGNIIFTYDDVSKLPDYDQIASYCSYNWDDLVSGQLNLGYSLNGVPYKVGCASYGLIYAVNDDWAHPKNFSYTNFHGSCSQFMTPTYIRDSYGGYKSVVEHRFGFRSISRDGVNYLIPFMVMSVVDSNGIIRSGSEVPISFDTPMPYSGNNVSNFTQTVPYSISDKYSVADVLKALEDKISTIPAPVVTPVPSPLPSPSSSPSTSPVPVISPVEIDIENILREIEQNQEKQLQETQDQTLIDIGIKDALDRKNADGDKTPDNPPPSGGMPDIGGIWDYVKNFLAKALIWMQLWYSGFVLLPSELQITLWALLVITIILGVLGVILR